TEQIFGTPQITPLKKLEDGFYIQGLSGGPTLAFKDMAMQLLGRLFEYELARRGATLNILGATSGDTGSSAEYAMRGRKGVRVFMLSPHGRMSAFQRAQMFSLQDENIFNIAVEGVFDDCQDMVKAVSGDVDFKRRWHIGAVNSINWARLLAQVVYYFAGYFQATEEGGVVDFTVPSGNFGNICAGHVARMMGLPIRRLVVATNENDVLDEFFRTGTYRVRSGAETLATSSPSMDISKASNFERFVFDVLGRDGAACARLFSQELPQKGQFELKTQLAAWGAQGQAWESGRSTHADRMATIAAVQREHGVLIDTHTADGVKVARERAQPGAPMIVLETAQPVKFLDSIAEALGQPVPLPEQWRALQELPQRVQRMPVDVAQLRAFIEQHCGG
ncbi:MAG: threonine synthase, partial [Ottowia sp.]|nr:threonine synthase [Ottowia sp.]